MQFNYFMGDSEVEGILLCDWFMAQALSVKMISNRVFKGYNTNNKLTKCFLKMCGAFLLIF